MKILTVVAATTLGLAFMGDAASAAPPATDCVVDGGGTGGGTVDPGDGGGTVEPSPVTVAVVDTTPVDTTPVDTTPVDTTPVDTTPVDTTPVDTTPYDPCIAYSGAPETTGSGLPTTGSTSSALVLMALGLTAAGAGLVAAARRRTAES
ncbi:MAG: LPXTG cell wall anchor domain-containing protein [Acidobacteria bacterium]|nr:LPXTG cell wall anchor domain-containing protein [Acidobacteriota bacterium]